MNTKLPECWASDPNARGVRIEVSPELTLLLPFDQFLYSELHQTADGQRLRAIFASHEVTLTGTASAALNSPSNASNSPTSPACHPASNQG